jgi:hypothetical protein
MKVMLSFLVDNLWCYQRLDKAVLETKLVEPGGTLALASIGMWRSFLWQFPHRIQVTDL